MTDETSKIMTESALASRHDGLQAEIRQASSVQKTAAGLAIAGAALGLGSYGAGQLGGVTGAGAQAVATEAGTVAGAQAVATEAGFNATNGDIQKGELGGLGTIAFAAGGAAIAGRNKKRQTKELGDVASAISTAGVEPLGNGTYRLSNGMQLEVPQAGGKSWSDTVKDSKKPEGPVR